MEKYSAPVLACRLGNLWHGSCSLPREKESSMAEPQVQLSVREIRKSFPGKGGDIPVLNGLNFDIYEKDFVSIIGPSGCGKTTIFNVIAGLLAADSGSLIYRGEPVASLRGRIDRKSVV